MSNSGESSSGPGGNPDPRVPLHNLSTVRERMDSLQQILSESVKNNTLMSKDEMGMVSSEISTAIQEIIVNGTALLACSQSVKKISDLNKTGTRIITKSLIILEEDDYMDCDIVEVDAVELLAEHVHFCDICGKGFKRDANLRMHMRAHGNQFKTNKALAKPESLTAEETDRKRRFSCPFEGCNRNKKHKKFRALKSLTCVRNHFKRSHCPKMYSCNRCNKKCFSVAADLRSHLKHCGELRWKCSCGTTFSRKDKLFGHMALFEGHMPAVVGEDNEVKEEGEESIGNFMDNEFFQGLLDGFDSIDGYNLQDVFESPSNNKNSNIINNSNWGNELEDDFLGFIRQS